MFIAYVVLVVLFSFVLVFTGRSKLVREKEVTKIMTRLGVPLSWFPVLAALEFAGVVGLLAGIVYRPLGIAAGVGLVLYFIGAVISHLRVRDVEGAPVPTVLVLVSAAPLVLGLATL